MNVKSNSTRIIEYVVGIIATALIGAGIFLYSLQEPARIVYAQQDQLETDLFEGMTLYAQNCSVCHGLAGEGIGSIPGLNNEALRQTDYDSLAKIIARGLYSTAMPAWANEDGGPLNEYQIGTLVMLIQSGDWQATQDRVVNLGLAPLVPFTTEPDLEVLKALEIVEGGDILAEGITLFAQECVACHGADGLGTTLAPVLNDDGIQSQPSETLERTINSGVAGTLMAGWDSSLTEGEVDALVYLLKNWDMVPTGAIPAPDTPVPVTEESLALGTSLYSSSCSNCHGPEGQGTPRAPALKVKGFLADTVDAAIQQIITLGVPSTAMPAWGDRMTDAEIQAIVGFIRAWEPTAPEVAEPARGGGPWWKSEGTQTPGGSKGGAPWMRNESGQLNNSALLPSGGGSVAHSNSGQSPSEPVQAQPMKTPQAEAAQVDSGTTAGQQQPQGVDHGSAGGGPPWANQSVELEWWLEINWQTISLSGSVISLALFLIIIAIKRLINLPV